MRRRLQADDNERDGSDSNCSDSVAGNTGAFRPTVSPKECNNAAGTSYPSPNISVGPPIHPPPHLLPYLYPPGLYPPPHLSLLHNPAAAMNPGLLFNAQLALAAQHPALFGHYSGHSPSSPLHGLKGHRFSPYSLPGLGSAFDAVTPGSNSGGPRSLSSSPHPRATSNSPPARPLSISPTPPHQTQAVSLLQSRNMTSTPMSSTSPNLLLSTSRSLTPTISAISTPSSSSAAATVAAGTATAAAATVATAVATTATATTTTTISQINKIPNNSSSSTPSELKSIEKMVNGLEVQHNSNSNTNGNLDINNATTKHLTNHDQ